MTIGTVFYLSSLKGFHPKMSLLTHSSRQLFDSVLSSILIMLVRICDGGKCLRPKYS